MGFVDFITSPEVIGAAGSVLGGLLGDDDDGRISTTTTIAPVQPRTEGQAAISDFDILYRDAAIQGMDQLTNRMAEQQQADSNFFVSQYLPFQQSIIETNAALLPTIERVAGATLEQNARDLVTSEGLKRHLETKVTTGDQALRSMMNNLNEQIAKIPSTEERVGQALGRVESEFGQAGRELTRKFQARGQAVTQATQRELAFEKAKARTGAAGAAAEAARREQLEGAQLGLAAEAQVTQVGAATRAQDVASLTGIRATQQAGLATPQVGGVTPTEGVGAAKVTAGLVSEAATQSFGTRQRQDQVTQIQAGVKTPTLTAGATGQAPQAPLAGVAQPGTPQDRVLFGEGRPTDALAQTGDLVAGATSPLKGILQGLINPR